MDIDVDESKKLCITNCPCLTVKYHGNKPDTGCRIFDEQETGMIRCQACLDSDITDKLSAIDVLCDMLNNKINPEIDALKKRNAVYKRAMEIMNGWDGTVYPVGTEIDGWGIKSGESLCPTNKSECPEDGNCVQCLIACTIKQAQAEQEVSDAKG